MAMRQIKILPSITVRSEGGLDRYLTDISHEPLISIDEEIRLAKLIHSGDEGALERLIRANLRFVVSVAKQYQGQGLGLVDLINEGNVGLLTAARRYDETRGFKFISYAVWWIRQSILQSLAENGRLVRLPLNKIGQIGRLSRFVQEFAQRHERRPTREEMGEELEMDPSRIDTLLLESSHHVSMDAPLVDDEEGCLLDQLASRDEPGTDAGLISESLVDEVEHALQSLPVREARVLRMSFGIREEERTLEEIGELLHLSRERVRQIREKGLSLLRQAQVCSVLRGYL